MINPFGGSLHYKAETVSTMADAAAGIACGSRAGDVFMAGHQTMGRGRIFGRVWNDRPGDSLLFTLILPPAPVPGDGFPLSLTAGLALAETLIRRYDLSPRIKWPNDVYLERKKIGGILVESSGDFSLLGIGINLNQPNFNGDLSRKAISLKMLTGSDIQPEKFLDDFLPVLAECIASEKGSFSSALKSRMEELLFDRGRRVRILSGHPDRGDIRSGIINGISPDGSLLLTGDDGTSIQLYSGEVLHGF